MANPIPSTDAPRQHSGDPYPGQEPADSRTTPGEPPPSGSEGVWRELLLVYGAIAAATILLDRLARWPAAQDYAHLAISALFLTVAVQLAQRRPGGLSAYGLALGGILEADAARPGPADDAGDAHGTGGAVADLLHDLRTAIPLGVRETAIAIGLAIVVFPPFVAGFYLFHGPTHGFLWRPPPDLANLVLAQLLLVGLPEEALFRGYFQTRLRDRYPPRMRFLGANLSPRALFFQAALFGLLHFLVDLNPARLAVFFPGLLFGYIRALRGGIGAALVFHALCNLLSEFLTRGFL